MDIPFTVLDEFVIKTDDLIVYFEVFDFLC
jgi:hypothetical protein